MAEYNPFESIGQGPSLNPFEEDANDNRNNRIEKTNPFAYDSSFEATNPFEAEEKPVLPKTAALNQNADKSHIRKASTPPPIFQRTSLQELPSKVLRHVASSGVGVVALESGALIKYNTSLSPTAADAEGFAGFKKQQEMVNQLFLDPSGRHLLISLDSREVLYWHLPTKKTRSVSLLKNYTITTVGWNSSRVTETSTKEFLIGTSEGLVLEMEVSPSGTEKSPKQVFDISENNDKAFPVIGICIFHLPPTSQQDRCAVIIASARRLYQFLITLGASVPVYQQLINTDNPYPSYLEFVGDPVEGCLAYYCPSPLEPARNIAWLNSCAVFVGTVDLKNCLPHQNFVVNQRLLKITESKSDPPRSIQPTEFHCVLLYTNRIVVVNLINDTVVYEEPLSVTATISRALTFDPVKKVLTAFISNSLISFSFFAENREAWKFYLDRQYYQLAEEQCMDAAHRDIVLTAWAQSLLENKNYVEAAVKYAGVSQAFESIALKFVALRNNEVLAVYLREKLVNLNSENQTQINMLLVWLVEVYLSIIWELKDRSASPVEIDNYQEKLKSLLGDKKVKGCLLASRHVLYKLFSSRGDDDNMLFFAELIEDHHKLIGHLTQNAEYLRAIEKLGQVKNVDIIYDFSPVLFRLVPSKVVKFWIDQRHRIDPNLILPSLKTQDISASAKSGDTCTIQVEAMNYLKFCVNTLDRKDKNIHNYLISLFCETQQSQELLEYLDSQGENSYCYDPDYALRVCWEHQEHQACVHIYYVMNHLEEAVDLALNKVDVKMAKAYANRETVTELKKKMWLKIARHMAATNPESAVCLLDECPLLEIQDVLPFLPDFENIDKFRDTICATLENFNSRIEDQKAHMESIKLVADPIRKQINALRKRKVIIHKEDKCYVCKYPLLTRPLCIFPCSHAYHVDCLVEEYMELSTGNERRELEDILTKLDHRLKALYQRPVGPSKDPKVEESRRDRSRELIQDLMARLDNFSAPLTATKEVLEDEQGRKQLKEKLDAMLTSECLRCGQKMIRTIDQPIGLNDLSVSLKSWE